MNDTVKLIAATLAMILAIAGNLPYVRDTLKDKIKPHPFSWLIWSIVSCINFFGQAAKGAGFGLISTGSAEIFTVIIFILSLRNSWKLIKRTDIYLLIIALLGLIPFYLTKSPLISLIIAVSIDFVAFLPTFTKTYKYP